MTEIVDSMTFFKHLSRLIKLPPKTRSVVLRCSVDELPTVTVEQYVDDELLIQDLQIQQFDLVPSETEEQCSTG